MPEPKRPLKVFLCHASQDKPAVRELYGALEAEGWIDPWLDKARILPGQDWRTVIERAVEESDVVIVCLSSRSVSKEGFVQREIKYAYDIALEKPEETIFLIPLRLDDCVVPRGLRSFHWVNYFGAEKGDAYSGLLDALKLRYEQKLKIERELALWEKETRGGETAEKVEKPYHKPVHKLNAQTITAIIGAVAILLALILSRSVWGPWMLPATDAATPTATDTVALTPASLSVTSTLTSISTPSPFALIGSSRCASDADILFDYVINQSSRIKSALGKQTREHSRCVESSYQAFEGGEMIWRSDGPDIYVLYANSEWSSHKNDFVFEIPTEVPCDVGTPPEDRFQPYLGFGKIWCENRSVREKLGYATIGENQDDRPILTFENGWLMLINYTVRVVFHDEKQWESVDMFEFEAISLESRLDLDAKISNLGLEQEEFITLPKAPLEVLDPVTGKFMTVPFRVGSKVSTQCAYRPEHPETIQISTDIRYPVSVYLLIQAGWGVQSYEYQTIGNVTLRFDNGEPLETPLILGYNIRDWAERPEAITTLVSRYAQTVWEGFDGVPGRIDILILDVPESYASSTLEEIQIDDKSRELSTSHMDPCIHLSAVTVSHLQLP